VSSISTLVLLHLERVQFRARNVIRKPNQTNPCHIYKIKLIVARDALSSWFGLRSYFALVFYSSL